MTIYLFDMDGTLTPARKPMEESFASSFLSWLNTHHAYIATGSDLVKVQEQLPSHIINAFTGIYCAMGNVLYSRGSYLYNRDFVPNTELIQDLENFRQNTTYPHTLFPNYIERRTGMINFSVLGRDCPYEERLRYADWDKTSGERQSICNFLSAKYPQYDFCVGGSISMDIIPKGCGKEQIAHHVRQCYPDEKIVFFGDRTFVGGNDYELASELAKMPNTEVIQVDSPMAVLQYLGLSIKVA